MDSKDREFSSGITDPVVRKLVFRAKKQQEAATTTTTTPVISKGAAKEKMDPTVSKLLQRVRSSPQETLVTPPETFEQSVNSEHVKFRKLFEPKMSTRNEQTGMFAPKISGNIASEAAAGLGFEVLTFPTVAADFVASVGNKIRVSSPVGSEIGEAMERDGLKFRQEIIEFASKVFPEDPQISQSSFGQQGYGRKTARMVGGAFGQAMEVLIASKLFGKLPGASKPFTAIKLGPLTTPVSVSTIAGSAIMAPRVYSSSYWDMLEHGVEPTMAMNLAIVNSVFSSAVEVLSVSELVHGLKGTGFLKSIGRGMIEEGPLEELPQQVFENITQVLGYKGKNIKSFKELVQALTEGALDATLVGSIVGGGMNAVVNGGDIKTDLIRLGAEKKLNESINRVGAENGVPAEKLRDFRKAVKGIFHVDSKKRAAAQKKILQEYAINESDLFRAMIEANNGRDISHTGIAYYGLPAEDRTIINDKVRESFDTLQIPSAINEEGVAVRTMQFDQLPEVAQNLLLHEAAVAYGHDKLSIDQISAKVKQFVDKWSDPDNDTIPVFIMTAKHPDGATVKEIEAYSFVTKKGGTVAEVVDGLIGAGVNSNQINLFWQKLNTEKEGWTIRVDQMLKEYMLMREYENAAIVRKKEGESATISDEEYVLALNSLYDIEGHVVSGELPGRVLEIQGEIQRIEHILEQRNVKPPRRKGTRAKKKDAATRLFEKKVLDAIDQNLHERISILESKLKDLGIVVEQDKIFKYGEKHVLMIVAKDVANNALKVRYVFDNEFKMWHYQHAVSSLVNLDYDEHQIRELLTGRISLTDFIRKELGLNKNLRGELYTPQLKITKNVDGTTTVYWNDVPTVSTQEVSYQQAIDKKVRQIKKDIKRIADFYNLYNGGKLGIPNKAEQTVGPEFEIEYLEFMKTIESGLTRPGKVEDLPRNEFRQLIEAMIVERQGKELGVMGYGQSTVNQLIVDDVIRSISEIQEKLRGSENLLDDILAIELAFNEKIKEVTQKIAALESETERKAEVAATGKEFNYEAPGHEAAVQHAAKQQERIDRVKNILRKILPKKIVDSINVVYQPDATRKKDIRFYSAQNRLEKIGVKGNGAIKWVATFPDAFRGVSSVEEFNAAVASVFQKQLDINTYDPRVAQDKHLRDLFLEWKFNALAGTDKYFASIMLKGVMKNALPGAKRYPIIPSLSKSVLNKVYEQFNKAENDIGVYKSYLKEIVNLELKSGDPEISASGKGSWVRIPKTSPQDKANYDYYVEKFRRLSCTSWCTATWAPESYVPFSDIYLLIVDDKTVTGIVVTDNTIVGAEGVNNNQIASIEWYTDIVALAEKHGFKIKSRQIDAAKHGIQALQLTKDVVKNSPEEREILGATDSVADDDDDDGRWDFELEEATAFLNDIAALRNANFFNNLRAFMAMDINSEKQMNDLLVSLGRARDIIPSRGVQYLLQGTIFLDGVADDLARISELGQNVDAVHEMNDFMSTYSEYSIHNNYAHIENILSWHLIKFSNALSALTDPSVDSVLNVIKDNLFLLHPGDIKIQNKNIVLESAWGVLGREDQFISERAFNILKSVGVKAYVPAAGPEYLISNDARVIQNRVNVLGLHTYEEFKQAMRVVNVPFSKKEGQVEGWVSSGQAYINAAVEQTDEDYAKLALHEIAHLGMVKMAKKLGGEKELNAVLQSAKPELLKALPELLARTGHSSLDDLAADYGWDLTSAAGEADMLSELAARWAEKFASQPRPTWWKKFLSDLGRWIKKFTGKTLTENEVNTLVAGFVAYGSDNVKATNSLPPVTLEGSKKSDGFLDALKPKPTGFNKKLRGGFENEGKGTPEGDGKDKAMRRVADSAIVELSHDQPSSSKTTLRALGQPTSQSKVVMLARNGSLKNAPLRADTKQAILNAWQRGATFVVGDMPGVDSAFIDYLEEIGAEYTLYFAGQTPRIKRDKFSLSKLKKKSQDLDPKAPTKLVDINQLESLKMQLKQLKKEAKRFKNLDSKRFREWAQQNPDIIALIGRSPSLMIRDAAQMRGARQEIQRLMSILDQKIMNVANDSDAEATIKGSTEKYARLMEKEESRNTRVNRLLSKLLTTREDVVVDADQKKVIDEVLTPEELKILGYKEKQYFLKDGQLVEHLNSIAQGQEVAGSVFKVFDSFQIVDNNGGVHSLDSGKQYIFTEEGTFARLRSEDLNIEISPREVAKLLLDGLAAIVTSDKTYYSIGKDPKEPADSEQANYENNTINEGAQRAVTGKTERRPRISALFQIIKLLKHPTLIANAINKWVSGGSDTPSRASFLRFVQKEFLGGKDEWKNLFGKKAIISQHPHYDTFINSLYDDKVFQDAVSKLVLFSMGPRVEAVDAIARMFIDRVSPYVLQEDPQYRKFAESNIKIVANQVNVEARRQMNEFIHKVMDLAGSEVGAAPDINATGNILPFFITELGRKGKYLNNSKGAEKDFEVKSVNAVFDEIAGDMIKFKFITEAEVSNLRNQVRNYRPELLFFKLLGKIHPELQNILVEAKTNLETPVLMEALRAGMWRGAGMMENIMLGFQHRAWELKSRERRSSWIPGGQFGSVVNPSAEYRTKEEFIMGSRKRGLNPIVDWTVSMVEYLNNTIVRTGTLRLLDQLKVLSNPINTDLFLVEYENSPRIKEFMKGRGYKSVNDALSQLGYQKIHEATSLAEHGQGSVLSQWNRGAFYVPFIHESAREVIDTLYHPEPVGNFKKFMLVTSNFIKRWLTVLPQDAAMLWMSGPLSMLPWKTKMAILADSPAGHLISGTTNILKPSLWKQSLTEYQETHSVKSFRHLLPWSREFADMADKATKMINDEYSSYDYMRGYENFELAMMSGLSITTDKVFESMFVEKELMGKFKGKLRMGERLDNFFKTVGGTSALIFDGYVAKYQYMLWEQLYNENLANGMDEWRAARTASSTANTAMQLHNKNIWGHYGKTAMAVLFTRNIALTPFRIASALTAPIWAGTPSGEITFTLPFTKKKLIIAAPKQGLLGHKFRGGGKSFLNAVLWGEASHSELEYQFKKMWAYVSMLMFIKLSLNAVTQFALSFRDDDDDEGEKQVDEHGEIAKDLKWWEAKKRWIWNNDDIMSVRTGVKDVNNKQLFWDVQMLKEADAMMDIFGSMVSQRYGPGAFNWFRYRKNLTLSILVQLQSNRDFQGRKIAVEALRDTDDWFKYSSAHIEAILGEYMTPLGFKPAEMPHTGSPMAETLLTTGQLYGLDPRRKFGGDAAMPGVGWEDIRKMKDAQAIEDWRRQELERDLEFATNDEMYNMIGTSHGVFTPDSYKAQYLKKNYPAYYDFQVRGGYKSYIKEQQYNASKREERGAKQLFQKKDPTVEKLLKRIRENKK